MNKLKITLLLIGTAILLTSCEDQEKNKLDNRVIDFWNFKIDKDYKKAYNFLSPGWKSTESQESYAQRIEQSVVTWIDVKLKKKMCSKPGLCQVGLEVTYEYMFRGATTQKMTIPTMLVENWMLIDNIWYNVPIKKNKGKR